jgi:hypothetical protein
MLKRLLAAATLAAAVAVPAVVLASPASADASYNLTYGKASQAARQAAESRYVAWGVDATWSSCRPQQHRNDRSKTGASKHHRWVCDWRGTDQDDDYVYGSFLVRGDTKRGYSAVAHAGGLKWSQATDDEYEDDGEYYSDATCSDDPEVEELPYCS